MQIHENIAKYAKRECRGTISCPNLGDQQQLLDFTKQLSKLDSMALRLIRPTRLPGPALAEPQRSRLDRNHEDR